MTIEDQEVVNSYVARVFRIDDITLGESNADFVVRYRGQLLIDSILNKDFPVAQGVLLVIGIMIILCNLLADLTYRLVDPRVDLS